MFEIQQSIKKIIERFIVNKTPTTAALSDGNTSIPVKSSRRYQCKDLVVIFNKPSMEQRAEGEVHTIVDIPDNSHIVIDEGLIENYSLDNSFVEKMVGGTFLEAVYIGDPEVIPQYPAITVDAKSKANSWLTLESTSEEFTIDISIYVEAEFYDTQYELMHRYTKAIETALFRSFYPLVKPFNQTTLVNSVNPQDKIIKIADEDLLLCSGGGWFWLESFDFLRSNRIRESLGNGVYELILPVSRSFDPGDLIIVPTRHIYNTIPAQIQYGTVNKGTTLKAAVITWTASEEVRRYVPFIDSLAL